MQKVSRSTVVESPTLVADPHDESDAAWELVLAACEASGIDPKQLFSVPRRETKQPASSQPMGQPSLPPNVAVRRQTAQHVVLYVDGVKCADLYGERAESNAMLLADGLS